MNVKVIIALTVTVILWASDFVGIRSGLVGYSPGPLALLRYLVASLSILILYLRCPTWHRPTWQEAIKIFVLVCFGFGIYNVALNYGELTVPAGIASFIISLIPVCIALLAIVFLRERLSGRAWLGIIISVCGVTIIAAGEYENSHFDMGVI